MNFIILGVWNFFNYYFEYTNFGCYFLVYAIFGRYFLGASFKNMTFCNVFMDKR